MTEIKVLSVAAEFFPLIKTGGLGDVIGALPRALGREGVDVTTLLPGYRTVIQNLREAQHVCSFSDLMGAPASLLQTRANGSRVLIINAPHLFDRSGGPYLAADGREWSDNATRFAALALVAAEIGFGCIPGYRPALIHSHDWHAGLVSAYQAGRDAGAPPVVLTIHNLSFQGRFSAQVIPELGIQSGILRDSVDGDQISFLKAGIAHAHRVATVSPTYAREIVSDAAGMGLASVLRDRGDPIPGILNGIDHAIWDPSTDPSLRARFSAATLERRRENKSEVQAHFGLQANLRAPLFASVSRLTEQKGVDLILDALPALVAAGAQFVAVGAGEPRFEQQLAHASEKFPGQVGRYLGYHEHLTHLVQGGSDMILAPSRFEPCGLTQMCAMRYGAVPVVARTGGLADTTVNLTENGDNIRTATGIQFQPAGLRELEAAIVRACALYQQQDVWRALQVNGMSADNSWAASASDYADLFRNVLQGCQFAAEKRRVAALNAQAFAL